LKISKDEAAADDEEALSLSRGLSTIKRWDDLAKYFLIPWKMFRLNLSGTLLVFFSIFQNDLHFNSVFWSQVVQTDLQYGFHFGLPASQATFKYLALTHDQRTKLHEIGLQHGLTCVKSSSLYLHSVKIFSTAARTPNPNSARDSVSQSLGPR